MKKGILLAAAVVLSAGLLTACGSSNQNQKTDNTPGMDKNMPGMDMSNQKK